MWKRAVWQEDLQEEEGVIPSNWIENKTVYWPPGTKALNAMKARQNPEKNWLKFPLIKVKFSSGSIIKDLNEVSMHLTSSSSSIKSREPKLDMYGKNLNSPCQKFFQEDISSLFAQDIGKSATINWWNIFKR
ncbi:uncharacterized protein LOC136084332 isoform X2 [Hydra vulgaris]|uniref:Uncharacterized protein LOC136084332 isoform X2 n=1 Tax=Hydra vulgaris TaxID=6087 RepID=A0ABM4CFH1_HYDVU